MNCVSAGSLPGELLEHADEHRDQERHQCHQHGDRERDHDGGVDHRGAHLAAQRGILLELVGDAHEAFLEHTTGLARAHHRDVQRPEHLGMARHRVRQQQARLDVVAHARDRFAQDLRPGLRLEHVERAHDRHAGGDHRRELARGHREVLGVDPREQLEVQLLRAVLVGDVDDDQAALLELLGDRLLGVGLDLALGLNAGEVHRLEDIRGHGYAAA